MKQLFFFNFSCLCPLLLCLLGMCSSIFTVGFLECCVSHQPVQQTLSSSSSVWLRCCSLNFSHSWPQIQRSGPCGFTYTFRPQDFMLTCACGLKLSAFISFAWLSTAQSIRKSRLNIYYDEFKQHDITLVVYLHLIWFPSSTGGKKSWCCWTKLCERCTLSL